MGLSRLIRQMKDNKDDTKRRAIRAIKWDPNASTIYKMANRAAKRQMLRGAMQRGT